MRRVASALVSLFVGAAAFGCDSTTSSTSSTTGTSSSTITSLLVDPSAFIGDVPCSAAPGASQSYVAQLFDVTDINAPVALAASPPVSCLASVTFSQVVAGRQYSVEVDGYDLSPSQLSPLGGATSGSRTMVLAADASSGPVARRWKSTCETITALASTRKLFDKCDDFVEEAATTGITVDPRSAMKSATPALACKKIVIDASGNSFEVGDVRSVDVRPDNPALPALLNLPCLDDAATAPSFTQSIVAGQTYTFRLEARSEAGGPVVWGASCYGLAEDGLVVQAVCDPFATDGAMEIIIDELLGPDTCSDTNIVTYDAELAGVSGGSAKGISCSKSVRFSQLSPGMHAATVVGYRAGGDVAAEATCTAVVEPGSVRLATCAQL